MYRIVYMSRTPTTLSDAELDEILKNTLEHDEDGEVTGLLLYARNTFFHVLEGERRIVERVFNTIFMDKRHNHVRVFQQRAIAQRRFADFRMGFRRQSVTDGAVPLGFFELTRTSLMQHIPTDAADDLRNLIRSYGEVKITAA